MKKLIEIQKSKKEDAKMPKSKIQEVQSSMPSKVEEPVPEEDSKQSKVPSGKTKTLDAEVINKAVEITQEKVNKQLLKSVPKTAAGFESDFNSLKKDMPTFYAYIKNIPTDTVVDLFKTVEISAELFATILKVVVDYGLSSDEGLTHTSSLMAALGKASNFDMTLMFMDNQEKVLLKQIVKSLNDNSGKLDAKVLKQVQTIYRV